MTGFDWMQERTCPHCGAPADLRWTDPLPQASLDNPRIGCLGWFCSRCTWHDPLQEPEPEHCQQLAFTWAGGAR